MIAPRFKCKFALDERGVKEAVQQASVEPLNRAGLLVEREAKRSMHQGGRFTGPFGGKIRTPSPPGAPPNVQTGNLRGSITHALGEDARTCLVGPTNLAPYGKVHEFGGRHHPRRPYMRPALVRTLPAIPCQFRRLALGWTPAGQRLNAKRGRSRLR